MDAARSLPSLRAPTIIAVGLLIVFATATIVVSYVPAFTRHLDATILLFAFPPWFVGPAALAALLVTLARSRGEAWSFVGAEVAAVASIVLLYTVPPFANTGGNTFFDVVAPIVFPIVQLAALLVYAAGVIAITDFVSAKGPDKEPRRRALAILPIATAVLLIGLGWLFSYLRALG